MTSNFADVQIPLFESRISAFTTPKTLLEVPVSVHEDEQELVIVKSLENPQLWYETEFPRDLAVAGMKKEMQSMMDFQMFDGVKTDTWTDDQLHSAISTRWAKVRKHMKT